MGEEIENTNKNEIAVYSDSELTFSNLDTPEKLTALGARLIKSGITPMTKPEDVMCAILLGRELGLGLMTSVNNIYSVNGRGSLGAHIIAAKLLEKGVKYEIVKDYAPLYTYLDNTRLYQEEDFVLSNLDKYQVISKDTPQDKWDKSRTQVIRTEVDRYTEIKFERRIQFADKQWYTQTHTQRYSWGDAVTAGLSTKDNWMKQPATMIRTRCLTLGARFIADDAILGCLDTAELTEIENIPTVVTQEGEVTILASKTHSPSNEK